MADTATRPVAMNGPGGVLKRPQASAPMSVATADSDGDMGSTAYSTSFGTPDVGFLRGRRSLSRETAQVFMPSVGWMTQLREANDAWEEGGEAGGAEDAGVSVGGDDDATLSSGSGGEGGVDGAGGAAGAGSEARGGFETPHRMSAAGHGAERDGEAASSRAADSERLFSVFGDDALTEGLGSADRGSGARGVGGGRGAGRAGLGEREDHFSETMITDLESWRAPRTRHERTPTGDSDTGFTDESMGARSEGRASFDSPASGELARPGTQRTVSAPLSTGLAARPAKKKGMFGWFSFRNKSKHHKEVEHLRRLKVQLQKYVLKLRKEAKKLLVSQAARRVEHEALYRDSVTRVGLIYDWGLFGLLPKMREHAAMLNRQMALRREVGVESMRVIQQRAQEASTLVAVVDMQLERALERNASDPVAPFASPVDDAFFKPVKAVIADSPDVISKRSDVEDAMEQLAAVHKEITELEPLLKPRPRDVLKKALVEVLAQEAHAKEAAIRAEIKAAEAEAAMEAAKAAEAGDGDAGSKEAASAAANAAVADAMAAAGDQSEANEAAEDGLLAEQRLHQFASICCDQRTREGRLLSSWCDRVLGGAAHLRKDNMTAFDGQLDVKGEMTAEQLQEFERLLNTALAGTDTTSEEAGAAAPGGSPTLAKGDLDGRRRSLLSRYLGKPASAGGEAAAPAGSARASPAKRKGLSRRLPRRRSGKGGKGGARSAVEGGKPPPPVVVLAFLRYFAQFIARSYATPKRYNAVLRSFVDRTVFPIIHTVCFESFNEMTSRRDDRFNAKVDIVRLMSAKDIGIDPTYCAAHLEVDSAAEALLVAEAAAARKAAEERRRLSSASSLSLRARLRASSDVLSGSPGAAGGGTGSPAATGAGAGTGAGADADGGVAPAHVFADVDAMSSKGAGALYSSAPAIVSTLASERAELFAAESPSKLGAYENPSDGRLFTRASRLLTSMPHEVGPAAMLGKLLEAIKSAMEEAGQRADKPSLPSTMDAESLFPLLVFIASRARWEQPHACLMYLESFAIGASKRGGMEDYYITTMAAALAWICHRPHRRSSYVAEDLDAEAAGGHRRSSVTGARLADFDEGDSESDEEDGGDVAGADAGAPEDVSATVGGEGSAVAAAAGAGEVAAASGAAGAGTGGATGEGGAAAGDAGASDGAGAGARTGPPVVAAAGAGVGAPAAADDAEYHKRQMSVAEANEYLKSTEKTKTAEREQEHRNEVKKLGTWLGQQEIIEDTLDTMF